MDLHITMPKSDVDDLDELAKECDLSRSEVLQNIIGYVLASEEVIDDIFGEEIDEEEESESEEEEDND